MVIQLKPIGFRRIPISIGEFEMSSSNRISFQRYLFEVKCGRKPLTIAMQIRALVYKLPSDWKRFIELQTKPFPYQIESIAEHPLSTFVFNPSSKQIELLIEFCKYESQNIIRQELVERDAYINNPIVLDTLLKILTNQCSGLAENKMAARSRANGYFERITDRMAALLMLDWIGKFSENRMKDALIDIINYETDPNLRYLSEWVLDKQQMKDYLQIRALINSYVFSLN